MPSSRWTIPACGSGVLGCLALLLPLLSATAAEATGGTAGYTGSADGAWPAARRHVRIIDGQAMRFTSRLATIVELNFTMGNGHQPGKQVISNSLTRIGAGYGGLKVNKFATAIDGSARGVPEFTVADLLAGEVIVANNISALGDAAIGTTKQTAIQAAIEAHGCGYLAFHGSGESATDGWPWFDNTLHPLRFQGHKTRSNLPIYKHLAESAHVVLENILKENTVPATVPDEVDVSGNEVLAQGIPTRRVRAEWFRWGRDISRDPAYRDKVTLLLKYDVNAMTDRDLDPQYRRKGGGLYSYLYRVGAGMTSYVLAGHENDELLDPNTGLDGGVGDFDRYVAQTLFFLAGYDTTACDAACDGFPVVDANNRLTGAVYSHASKAIPTYFARDISFDPARPAFSQPHDVSYSAVLTDLSGKVVASRRGRGAVRHEFDRSSLKPGVYCLGVKLGRVSARVKRYVITASAP